MSPQHVVRALTFLETRQRISGGPAGGNRCPAGVAERRAAGRGLATKRTGRPRPPPRPSLQPEAPPLSPTTPKSTSGPAPSGPREGPERSATRFLSSIFPL